MPCSRKPAYSRLASGGPARGRPPAAGPRARRNRWPARRRRLRRWRARPSCSTWVNSRSRPELDQPADHLAAAADRGGDRPPRPRAGRRAAGSRARRLPFFELAGPRRQLGQLAGRRLVGRARSARGAPNPRAPASRAPASPRPGLIRALEPRERRVSQRAGPPGSSSCCSSSSAGLWVLPRARPARSGAAADSRAAAGQAGTTKCDGVADRRQVIFGQETAELEQRAAEAAARRPPPRSGPSPRPRPAPAAARRADRSRPPPARVCRASPAPSRPGSAGGPTPAARR